MMILISHINRHQSVTSIVFTNNGRRCFSSDSKGTLALYDATHTAYPLLTILGTIVLYYVYLSLSL